MSKTIEQLLALAQQIKNETNAKQNTATRVGGSLEDIIDKIEDVITSLATVAANEGTLASLTTTQKGNLVAAINELVTAISARYTKTESDAITGSLNSLATTVKSSLVGAINDLESNKATKAELATIGQKVGKLPSSAETEDTTNFAFADKNGYTPLEVVEGYIKTKYFDSKKATITETASEDYDFDFAVCDKNGFAILIVKDGVVLTKESASANNKKLKIAVIGNSYSLDSFMYLPFMLKNQGVDIELGIYYRASGKISDHVNEWSTGASSSINHHLYYIDTTTDTSWKVVSTSATPKMLVQYKKWDMIVLQQQSSAGIDASTFGVNVRNLINLIYSAIDYPIRIAWNVTINANKSNESSAQAIFTNIKNTMQEEPIDFVFPYGTAIFNARTDATFDALGDGGHLCYSDNLHLQEGMPCYIASLANTEAIYREFYPHLSVVNDNTKPTSANITTWNVQGQQGTPCGLTEENYKMAQICAIQANRNKFSITNLTRNF